MEIVLGLLVELIGAALLPMLLAAVELVTCVLSLIGELLIAVVMGAAESARRRTADEKPASTSDDGPSAKSAAPAALESPADVPVKATAPAAPRDEQPPATAELPELPEPRSWADYRRWARRTALVSAVALGLTLLAALAVQIFAFESAVRWAMGRVERESGIAVSFQSAEGSLLTGRLALREATIVRHDDPVSDFDLEVDQLQVDIDVWRLLWRRLRFEKAEAEGVRGTYLRRGKRPPEAPPRQYEISRLRIVQMEVEASDDRLPLQAAAMLSVDEAVIQPLRSRQVLFDTLFQAQVRGRINGKPFTAETTGEPTRTTRWTFAELPVAVVSSWGGPFEWLDDGRLTLTFRTTWDEDDARLPTTCEFHFQNVTARAPEQLPLKARLLAAPVTAWINAKTGDFEVDFQVEIPRSTFEGHVWLGTTDLASQLGDGLREELVALATGIRQGGAKVPQAVKDAGKTLLDRLKNR